MDSIEPLKNGKTSEKPQKQLKEHQSTKESFNCEIIVRKYAAHEAECYESLMNDELLKEYVSDFKGPIYSEGPYLEYVNPLVKFKCLSKVKIGYRSFSLHDIKDQTIFEKLFKKMIEVDPFEPTSQEKTDKAITKYRYRKWVDEISSTSTLAFRFEKIWPRDLSTRKNFKTIKNVNEIEKLICNFTKNDKNLIKNFINDLEKFKNSLLLSDFLNYYEIIGSSILFEYQNDEHQIKMINFERTFRLPEGVKISHLDKWTEGSHEDGYLKGVLNLIDCFRGAYIRVLEQEKNKKSNQN